MIKTIFGMILLLLPFLLIYRFKNKKIGFAYILSFLVFFQLIVAVFTQLLGIFNYLVVLVINLFMGVLILRKIDFNVIWKKFREMKIDWVLIFVIVVVFISLFSIHYNYTGKITTVPQPYTEVKNMKYVYPYFSDEWYAVSLIQYSIDSGNLPLVNPLSYHIPFQNLELPFHSFVSEIMLILDLDPLIQYTILTIFVGLLICILVYLFLRLNQISKLISGITAISLLYVVNGANLPGIWNLIPIMLGVVVLLLSFIFISIKRNKMILFTSFLVLIFYPPLFVISATSLFLYFGFIKNKEIMKKYLKIYFGILVLSFFILTSFAYLNFNSLNKLLSYIFSKVFYETFTVGFIPQFQIWKVVPLLVLVFGGLGVFKIFRKKLWLAGSVIVGLIFWWLYSFETWRFIIEYERIVVTTSILITIVAGFGLQYFVDYLDSKEFIKKYNLIKLSQVLILILFLVVSFSYTNQDFWQELKLKGIDNNKFYNPAAPANNYLIDDDLRVFEGISGKRFLSFPWKGTVIGVATRNYPLSIKPGTISMGQNLFSEFVNSDCEKKKKIVKDYELDYIYSLPFDCEGFKLKDVSSEGLHLYEV